GIIVGTDHDLNQLEGIHFNPVTNSWQTVTKEQATYNINLMLLSGCSTDKVRGLKKGCGVKTAEKLLKGFPTESQFWEVINLYLTEYGEYKGIEEFYIQYKLLKILRNKEDFIIPEECKNGSGKKVQFSGTCAGNKAFMNVLRKLSGNELHSSCVIWIKIKKSLYDILIDSEI
ncbi:MAG TPA: hypothetical protein PLC35_06355, partial [Methanosarcina vacuolata]|nr:hypothetical protein [Methanosarcina vacuolata]